MTMGKTDRRSFLKTGALVAAPFAAAAPVAALAADDRLARLEAERAVEALQRKFLRHLNGAGDCGEFIARSGSVDLGEGLRSIAGEDDALIELGANGLAATGRCSCRVEREAAFAGHSTLEQMARFQGHGGHRHEERRVLETEFIKGNDGWRIASARLA
jgi:hypothetical protein